MTIDVWAGLASIPSFNEDDEGDRTPQAVLDFRRLIGEADGPVRLELTTLLSRLAAAAREQAEVAT